MTEPRPVAAVIYLDVDDEITSAATRIRGVRERRVALVLPGGSRVSTSRINFRLLAREAETRGRDLAIVAPEASARALAASAGLPAFGSVTEFEDALEREAPDIGPTDLLGDDPSDAAVGAGAPETDATAVFDAPATARQGQL